MFVITTGVDSCSKDTGVGNTGNKICSWSFHCPKGNQDKKNDKTDKQPNIFVLCIYVFIHGKTYLPISMAQVKDFKNSKIS